MSNPTGPFPPSQPTPGSMPAGWYADPQVPGQQRWFDGTTWTAQTQPASDPTLMGPPPGGAAPPMGPPPGMDPQASMAPPPMGPPPGMAPRATNGLGTAALVLGILAVVGCWIPLLNVFAIILGVVAVILGLIGLRKAPKTLAVVGTILGGVGIIVAIIVLVVLGKAVDTIVNDPSSPLKSVLTTQKTVVWTATVSTGQASVTWGSAGGESTDTFTGTWTKTTTATSSDFMATLTVTGDAMTDQQLTCTITVDGKEVAKQSGQTMALCVGSLVG